MHDRDSLSVDEEVDPWLRNSTEGVDLSGVIAARAIGHGSISFLFSRRTFERY
jgi:hypothetical protein